MIETFASPQLSKSILIVDDTPANLRLLSQMLAQRGYKIRVANSGGRALESVRVNPPDLILLDVLMPGMNGCEVCRHLKTEPLTHDIPIIFLSALDDIKDKVEAFAAGGVDYITKPFQVEEVLARVETHLALRELQKQLQLQNSEIARLLEQTRQDAQTKTELLKEVNHRVKNNLVAIIGLLLTEERYAPAEGRCYVETVIQDLIQRVEGLLAVHQLLSESNWGPLRLSELAEKIIHATLNMSPPNRLVEVDITAAELEVSPRQAGNLALVLNELTTNTMKYALPEKERGCITVRLALEDTLIYLEYRDNGPGYPGDVLSLARHNIGLELVRQLVTQTLRGTLTLRNEDGAVTILRIKTEETNRT